MTTPRALTHPLRRFIRYSILPVFILNLVYLVLHHAPVPTLGVPILLVAVVAPLIVQSSLSMQQGVDHGPKTSSSVKGLGAAKFLFVFDLVMALGFLIVAIFSWLDESPRTRGLIILQTYASMPFLMASLFHGYFALLTLSEAFDAMFISRSCPHCNHDGYLPLSEHIPSYEQSQGQVQGCEFARQVDKQRCGQPDAQNSQTTELLCTNAAQGKGPQSFSVSPQMTV